MIRHRAAEGRAHGHGAVLAILAAERPADWRAVPGEQPSQPTDEAPPVTRVAVVALSEDRAQQLAESLRRQGLVPELIPAADVLPAIKDMHPDAVLVEFSAATRAVLDGLLGDKQLTERVAIVALLAPDDLAAYEAGPLADDFVVWPALPEELAARVRITVRKRRHAEPEHILRFGDLVIDLANYRVSVAGQHVALTYKEYELLRFLALNRGKVFTREALLNRVWGYDYYGGARTVDVHIRRLRAKIEDGHRTFIETIRNVGYRFRDEA
jgi:two-component system alkaline phosphatase synthesis response regulator PhoP